MPWVLISAFALSFIASTLLIHSAFAHDPVQGGPQKFHRHKASRIGGISIFSGWSVALALSVFTNQQSLQALLFLWLCTLPVFLTGLAEDIFHRIKPFWRLLAAAASAILATSLLGAQINRLDIEFIDQWLAAWPLLALALTWFAITGVSHAFNIIDGYNGLSGVVAVMALAGLAYAGLKVQDFQLMVLCLAAIGATAGFLVWNYPRGLIFAGDGGAYFLGFMVALISVLLVQRHPEVSPWFPMLLVAYPVSETLFSIYRRRKRGRAAVMADAMHMHQIIYRRLVRWMVGSAEAHHHIQRNARTSPYLWGLAATSIVPAILLWRNTAALIVALALFTMLYVWLYATIIRFRTPKWLIIRKHRRCE